MKWHVGLLPDSHRGQISLQRAKPKQMGHTQDGASTGVPSLLSIRYKSAYNLENPGRKLNVYQTHSLMDPLALAKSWAPPGLPESTLWSTHFEIHIYLCGYGCIPTSSWAFLGQGLCLLLGCILSP